jgi:hypothetical protein
MPFQGYVKSSDLQCALVESWSEGLPVGADHPDSEPCTVALWFRDREQPILVRMLAGEFRDYLGGLVHRERSSAELKI